MAAPFTAGDPVGTVERKSLSFVARSVNDEPRLMSLALALHL